MNSMKNVLMKRDGMSNEDANREMESARESLWEIIEFGGTLDDLEEMMAMEYGLEPDYLEELLF